MKIFKPRTDSRGVFFIPLYYVSIQTIVHLICVIFYFSRVMADYALTLLVSQLA